MREFERTAIFGILLTVGFALFAIHSAETPVAGAEYAELLSKVHHDREQANAVDLFASIERIKNSRPTLDGREYAYLLFESIAALETLGPTDRNLQRMAYTLSREARIALLAAPVNDQMFLIQRLAFVPARYNPGFDERDFVQARREEAELMLKIWQNTDLERTRIALDPRNYLMPEPPAGLSAAERKAWQVKADEQELREVFRSRVGVFTNSMISLLSSSYARAPHDFGELRGLFNHYLTPEAADSVWAKFSTNSNVTTRRPVNLPELVRTAVPKMIVPDPRFTGGAPMAGIPSDSRLPAAARPSKLRDGDNMRSQAVMGAVSPGAAVAGAEPGGSGGGAAGGRVLWPWAVLGIGALAWGWWKIRGR